MSKPPPFADAETRHRRAQEHLRKIEAIVAAIERERQFAVADPDPDTGEERLKLPEAASPGLDLRVRIGEFIYNLRATLDYIAYVVSGRKDTAQFPLEDYPKVFERRITGAGNAKPFLKGVSPPDCALIEKFQPYNGVNWAKLLRDLSNPDKHRHLVVLDATSKRIITRENIGALYPSTKLYPSDTLYPSAGYEKVNVEGSIEIAFPERGPVRETLKELETQVGKVLFLFQHR